MTPYSKPFRFTTTSDNEVVPLDFPGRCTIKQISAYRAAGAALGITFYSRAFAGSTVKLAKIRAGAGSKLDVTLVDQLPVTVGDSVTIAGTTTYDGSFVVLAISDSPSENPQALVPVRTMTLDTAYSVDKDLVGTAQTVVPSAEQDLFKVGPALSGSGVQASETEFTYANQDPSPKRNIGVPRKIYAKIATADTYRISIIATESVAMGG